ncbi:chromodomain-helicase-DNA-binding protein 2-like [Harpegnathos saltator]|uniref:chromodomain-helicase-DNA-binding protein 2-like n=1 Tax=Harpegnathos saltator TaxID=610380 RepID=UPI000DBEF289|nr:chromodomain-helicase-DNA-binding protein 2-like [Harpegnathos saltator]
MVFAAIEKWSQKDNSSNRPSAKETLMEKTLSQRKKRKIKKRGTKSAIQQQSNKLQQRQPPLLDGRKFPPLGPKRGPKKSDSNTIESWVKVVGRKQKRRENKEEKKRKIKEAQSKPAGDNKQGKNGKPKPKRKVPRTAAVTAPKDAYKELLKKV